MLPTNVDVWQSGLPSIGSNLPTDVYAPPGWIISTVPPKDIEKWLIDLNNATGDRARNEIIEQLNTPPPMPDYPYYPDEVEEVRGLLNPDLPGNR